MAETLQRKHLRYSKPVIISVFFMLYSYQGFLFGLNEAIKLLLKEKGAADSDLSLQALTTSPFYLKFIAAPFLDVYYSKRIGKRMTWILPISLIASAFFFLFADKMEHWLIEKNYESLALLTFIQFVFIAIQDVAIDGMVCEVLNPEDFEKGSLMQTLGQTVGPFLCCNLFILLISPKFAEKQFGMENSLITMPDFIRFLGIMVLASSAFSLAVVNEKGTNIVVIDEPISEKGQALVQVELAVEVHEPSFFELLSLIPKMFVHPNVRYLLIHPAIFELFLIFTDSNCFLKLLEKGFDLLYLNEFEMYFFALDLIILAILGKMNILDNLWKYYSFSVDALYVNAVGFWLAFYFLPIEYTKTWIVYLVVYKLVRYLSSVKFTAASVYTQYVADRSCGGSFLTIVYSAHNFCRLNIPALIFRVTKFTGFMPLVICLGIYDLIFRVSGVRNRWVRYFEKAQPHQFALKYDHSSKDKGQ